MICTKCRQSLPDDSKFCPFCGTCVNEPAPPQAPRYTDTPWQQSAQPYPGPAAPYPGKPRKKSGGKIALIVTAVVLVLTVLGAAVFMIGTYIDREQRYEELTRDMMSVSRYRFPAIGRQIDEFPLDYRDIRQIRSEYNKISKHISVLNSAELSEQSAEACRDACAALIEFDEDNYDWDLSGYLEDTLLPQCRGELIYGREWKTADGSYSFFWRSQDDGELLTTDLPNDKDPDKQYYFYTDYESGLTTFSYENQKNSSDRFDAYKIVDVSCKDGKWQLKIFCYSDSRTYTLE